jgi:signal transduction histidine kinase/DNA-binding response OmpR family regulator
MYSGRISETKKAAGKLGVTVRRTITSYSFLVITLAVFAAVFGAHVIGQAFPSLGSTPAVNLAMIGALAVAVGGVAALALGRALAGVVAEPLELLVANLIISGEALPETGSLFSARPLRLQDFRREYALIEQRMVKAAARVRSSIVELEQARERANAENSAKSQFLANMSHELRTPLNAILGYAMLLTEDAADTGTPSMIDDLDRIQQAGRHLLTLINEILDLSKIEAGKTLLERSVVDIAAAVRAATAHYDDTAHRNGNGFTVNVEPDVGIMMGDPAKLHQCLVNLVSNAFKFSKDGRVAVEVTLVTNGRSNDVVFRVSDTGIGIKPETLKGLFEPFTQADNSSSRKFGGAGLGLAVSRRLARLMSGDITVESQEGKGAIFSLTLPLNAAAAQLAAGNKAGEQLVSIGAISALPGTHERTALIIDDSESAVDLLTRWMKRLDYGVISATDGEVGLALARAHKPDLILLDVLMPGRSGYDILGELRADDQFAQTPIILVTVDDDRARGLGAGATEYVRKPVDEQQLRAMLEVYRTKARGEILIVEDDDDAADIVRRCAEQVGFKTVRAVDGEEGLKLARERLPNAILLDLLMPNCDGFEVIEALTADESLRAIPVIVLSACEISLQQHRKIVDAGYMFCAKGASSPREIAQHLKELVR